nr:hypothetical protein [Candidatus Sigynarchaeota archaeon]
MFTLPPATTGTLRSVDHEARRVDVELDHEAKMPADQFSGRVGFVTCGQGRSRTFRLIDVELSGAHLRFSTRCSLIDAVAGAESPKAPWLPDARTASVNGTAMIVAIMPGDRFFMPPVYTWPGEKYRAASRINLAMRIKVRL